MNKKEKKKLDDEVLALFLFMLSYSNKKDFKELLKTYRQHRNDLKDNVNRIYAKYSKSGEFHITQNNMSKEIKVLEKDLKRIGQDLRNKEDVLLYLVLMTVCKDTYDKSNQMLSKYLNISLKNRSIKKSINYKIDGKTVFDRNKINKEKLITKVKNDIKRDLKKGLDIGLINKTIDKNFGYGAYVSQRLLENEIARNFNNSLIKSYKDNGIEKVEFVAVLDERTTPLCESLDGDIFLIDDAPIPPLHINCRSTLLII